MKLFAAALAITAFFVGPARADDDLKLDHGQVACLSDKNLCVVRQDDLAQARKNMHDAEQLLHDQADLIDRQQRELRTLRESKGCAKVTPIPRTERPAALWM